LKGRIAIMQHSLKLSIVALTIGIVVTLLLYIFVVQSPYILGVGCVLGVYLAKISSLKSAAFHGAIIAIPLAVYINFISSAGGDISPTIIGKSASIFIFTLMGGILGLIYVWIRNQLRNGTTFFS
jgi:hypothetical protein